MRTNKSPKLGHNQCKGSFRLTVCSADSVVIWILSGHSVLFSIGLANTKFLLTSEEEIAKFSRSGGARRK